MKFGEIEVGGGSKLEAVPRPGNNVVSLNRVSLDWRCAIVSGGPDVEIDDVESSMIDEHRHLAFVEVIQSAAHERVALRGKVLNWGRELQLSVEPGLDGVLIGRNDVHQVIRHQGTHVSFAPTNSRYSSQFSKATNGCRRLEIHQRIAVRAGMTPGPRPRSPTDYAAATAPSYTRRPDLTAPLARMARASSSDCPIEVRLSMVHKIRLIKRFFYSRLIFPGFWGINAARETSGRVHGDSHAPSQWGVT